MKKLRCDQNQDCENPVTHIDNKGFIYCTTHGETRKFYKPCRKLRSSELKKLAKGLQINHY